jgi:hypothetical protein
MFEGVDRFLRHAQSEGHTILIVSHKTEYGHMDPERLNLRQAALDWMEQHRFFHPDGYAIARENVYFEGTRAEKLARIARLGCTHFIDDLEEVLEDQEFPATVKRVLFAAETLTGEIPSYPMFSTWEDIEKAVLGERV